MIRCGICLLHRFLYSPSASPKSTKRINHVNHSPNDKKGICRGCVSYKRNKIKDFAGEPHYAPLPAHPATNGLYIKEKRLNIVVSDI